MQWYVFEVEKVFVYLRMRRVEAQSWERVLFHSKHNKSLLSLWKVQITQGWKNHFLHVYPYKQLRGEDMEEKGFIGSVS